MNHIYLSPHLDDAILSCGGLIYNQTQSGHSVAVVNLCAGFPTDAIWSPFVKEYHSAWGALVDPVDSRRQEDKAVMEQWHVTAHYWDTPDSIYRSLGGSPLYPNLEALFAQPHPQEEAELPPMWQERLRTLYPDLTDSVLYAPLGAANHVDHQLVRLLGWLFHQEGCQVWFYEDYPHIERPGALAEAQTWFGDIVWQAQTYPIDIEKKLEAIRGYKSQVSFIFGDDQTMARRVKEYTAQTACAISILERTRHRVAGTDGRRERLWRALFGYHAHAERLWRPQ